MKVRLMRFKQIRDEKGESKNLEVSEDVNSDDVLCLYKDRYNVSVLLKRGTLLRVNHTIEELTEAFEL